MPVNRNALIRYKTIDKCLQNRYRRWTLDDLIDACSDALCEYEGICKGISRRTVQLDIQMMRSDKLGYNAPIVVYDNKYYTYEDENYSITNIPITDQDLEQLSETVAFLKQFKGFSHFQELDSMVQKLEDHVYSQKTAQKPVIDFEKNENLKGLEYLDLLYRTIIQKHALELTYQSFKARTPASFRFDPYLLKEFRNRWFLIGSKNKGLNIMTLALDRIIEAKELQIEIAVPDNFDAETYFKHAIGVTVTPGQRPHRVVLFISHRHAPYVLTKPLHHSQKVIERDFHGITIELFVQLNFELEKEILGFGEAVMVIEPIQLKRSITSRLSHATENYNTTISEKGVVTAKLKLEHQGAALISNVYASRHIRQVDSYLNKNKLIDKKGTLDTEEHKKLFEMLINKNITRILNELGHGFKLSSATICSSNHPWNKEDVQNSIDVYIELNRNNAANCKLQAILGSQKNQINKEDQNIIIENSLATEFIIEAGNALLIKPSLLKQFVANKRAENKFTVICLRFKNEISTA